ncbi:MAG: hypothetical protein QT03_C0001G0685 [archaeon GW2011_AR10]|nr:MAG: hypothetical protein QT03_C0001G0685 [archaeon GW2011_AR10]
MALFNKTKKTQIIGNVRIAGNFFSQLKGLMFESKKKFDYALVFPLPYESKSGASIHCFFVFFPIDIVFLGKNRRVVDVKESIAPFTPLYVPKKPAKFFVELPAGKAKGISVGDELEWSA